MTGVNMVFFLGGPQLGELEAGAVANWFGAAFSVITGGIGCLLATTWVAATTPALRQYRASAGTQHASAGTLHTSAGTLHTSADTQHKGHKGHKGK
jgi:hypothetical protein